MEAGSLDGGLLPRDTPALIQRFPAAVSFVLDSRRRRWEVDSMTKPTILAVDDDPVVSPAIARDLRARYGADYRIIRTASGAQALAMLAKLTPRDRLRALVASDQPAGDVRLASMKRVASAVGEGAMSVYLVHRYLAAS
jgi:hypothetical protein